MSHLKFPYYHHKCPCHSVDIVNSMLQGNDNYVGIAARDTANALRVLTGAVRGVAANSKDRQEQTLIIDSARDIIARSNQLLEVARNAIDNPNDPDNQQKLQQVITWRKA